MARSWLCCSATNDDIVDRDVHQLDEEANEAHHDEPDTGRLCNHLELCLAQGCFVEGRG